MSRLEWPQFKQLAGFHIVTRTGGTSDDLKVIGKSLIDSLHSEWFRDSATCCCCLGGVELSSLSCFATKNLFVPDIERRFGTLR